MPPSKVKLGSEPEHEADGIGLPKQRPPAPRPRLKLELGGRERDPEDGRDEQSHAAPRRVRVAPRRWAVGEIDDELHPERRRAVGQRRRICALEPPRSRLERSDGDAGASGRVHPKSSLPDRLAQAHVEADSDEQAFEPPWTERRECGAQRRHGEAALVVLLEASHDRAAHPERVRR